MARRKHYYVPRSCRVEKRLKRCSRRRTATGCLLWTGAKQTYGYGQLSVNGKANLVHRLAYELYIGPIPENMFVMHTCRTPKCINPDHLFTGTRQDCINRRSVSDRQARGETHGNVKLLEKDILSIFEMRRFGCTQKEIAKHFSVSQIQVHRVLKGQTQKHITQHLSI